MVEHLKNLINNGDYEFQVKFVSKVAKPISFVKSLINPYKEPIYHICDIEGIYESDIKTFQNILADMKEAERLKGYKYNLAYSNLCFELWLILHKKNFTKPLSLKYDYKDEIVKCYNLDPDIEWDKIKAEEVFKNIVKNITISDIKNAIKRAETIDNNNYEINYPIDFKGYTYFKENPSLNIYKFINLVFKKCKI